MIFLAHHVAVELFGREFSPHTVLEHVCAFAVAGLILSTSVYGTCMLASKLSTAARSRRAS